MRLRPLINAIRVWERLEEARRLQAPPESIERATVRRHLGVRKDLEPISPGIRRRGLFKLTSDNHKFVPAWAVGLGICTWPR